MRIDLHTHSAVSDGTQSPTELVRAAAVAGLDVLALTDHDTTAGWAEARAAAEAAGVELLPGLEISTTHRGRSVHLLGYGVDPGHAGLGSELRRIVEGRSGRLPAMVARLRRAGVDLTEDDVRAAAGDAVPGRPHVADAMVARKIVRSREKAFELYLDEGGPGYVGRYAADLTAMVGLVGDAGGVAVVAHPWGRHDPADLPPDDLAALADAGLAGLEVDHPDHDEEHRTALRQIARDLDLVVTGSSDHHGTGKSERFHLGACTTAPEEYERLLALLAAQ